MSVTGTARVRAPGVSILAGGDASAACAGRPGARGDPTAAIILRAIALRSNKMEERARSGGGRLEVVGLNERGVDLQWERGTGLAP